MLRILTPKSHTLCTRSLKKQKRIVKRTYAKNTILETPIIKSGPAVVSSRGAIRGEDYPPMSPDYQPDVPSDVARNRHEITASDIIPDLRYAMFRKGFYWDMRRGLKALRRVEVSVSFGSTCSSLRLDLTHRSPLNATIPCGFKSKKCCSSRVVMKAKLKMNSLLTTHLCPKVLISVRVLID